MLNDTVDPGGRTAPLDRPARAGGADRWLRGRRAGRIADRDRDCGPLTGGVSRAPATTCAHD